MAKGIKQRIKAALKNVDREITGNASRGGYGATQLIQTLRNTEMTPAAYITETEKGDMVWRVENYIEACTYCDDDEFPEPLYKSQAHVMQQALDALCLPCSRWNKQQTLIVNAAIGSLRNALDARETK